MYSRLFRPTSDHAHEEYFQRLFRAYNDVIVDRFRARLPAQFAQLAQEGCSLSFRASGAAGAWRPEMGYLNWLLKPDNAAVGNAAAQYVLCAIAAGCSCEATLPTVPDEALYFEGYRLTTGETTRIRCVGDSLVIFSRDSQSRLLRVAGHWRRECAEEPTRRVAKNIILLGGACDDPEMKAAIDVELPHSAFDEAVAITQQAIELIRNVAPDYLLWCDRVLNRVQLVGCKKAGASTSRSAPNRPGMILMSHPAHLVQFAESIVHECTHQYFYLLAALTNVKRDPNEVALFYSSIVARQRPIEKILFAYHATANIILFLRLLTERSPSLAPAARTRLREHTRVCAQLLEVLDDNNDLLSDHAVQFWVRHRESVEKAAQETT